MILSVFLLKYGSILKKAEAVGQECLQLFVDAGVPLDEALVNNLIKEVLMEKASK